MAVVAFQGVAKVYPGGARAVSDMNLEIGDGEFVVLVGPSGCGKTTALRMLAGLETITEGVIRIGDRVVNHVAPRDRDIAMVFQNYALYPHLKVYDNIAFGLRLRKVPKDEIDKRVRHAAEVLGLEDFLDRKPRALSGGQRQRVAMGRAIVREPQAFLMDEPLSNLDAKLRVQMRSEIGSLQRDLGVTTLYVTHDQVEAMTMGDRVAVMRKGELQQVAPPQELYDRPVSLFVAGFIGSPTMNMVEAEVQQDGDRLAVQIGGRRLALAPEAVQAHPALRGYDGKRVVVGIRPEDMEDAALAPDTPEDQRLRGTLMLREALGSEINAHVEVDAPPVLTEDTRELAEDIGTGHHHEAHEKRGSQTSKLVGRFNPRTRVQPGDSVEIAVDTRALHFFDIDSGLGIYDEPVSLDARRNGSAAATARPRRITMNTLRHHTRLLLSVLAIAAIAAIAAGCGKSPSNAGAASPSSSANANVSGNVSVMAVWSGAEQKAFQKVIDGFTAMYPNVKVKYTSAGDQLPTVLSTAVQGGNPPSIAAVPQPGLMKDFVSQGALKPITYAKSVLQENYGPSWITLGTVDGTLYGFVFKGANKSTVWYNVKAFSDAGVQPPATWEDLLAGAKTLKASGVKAYSIGGADGWTLTDLFENIYLRTAGPDMYDKLTNLDIPWTDASVATALQDMAQIFGDTSNIVGGSSGALQTDFPTSVTNVFTTPPKGAMVFEGDFVQGVILDSTKAEPETGFNQFAFPSVNGSPASVVGGGDTIVAFKDDPATQAFVKYLATPEAATIWVKIGGFSSPNLNVDPSAYPDAISRATAGALAAAEVFRFDMSDLTPPAFGGTVGQGEWKILQDFLKDPSDVKGTQQALQQAAAKAYGK